MTENERRTIKKIYKLYHNERLPVREIVRIEAKKRFDINIADEKWIISTFDNPIWKEKTTTTGKPIHKFRLRHNEYPVHIKEMILRRYKSEKTRSLLTLLTYLRERHEVYMNIKSLQRFANRNGVKRERKFMDGQMKVTQAEETEIVRLYDSGNGLTMDTLALKYNYKDKKSIRSILIKYGVDIVSSEYRRKRNRPYDGFNFKNIDSFEKAVLLGWGLSDGTNLGGNIFQLGITDLEPLIYLCTKINLHPPTPVKGTNGRKDSFRIHMHGDDCLEGYERLDLIPNKTYLLKGPILTKEEKDQFLGAIFLGIIGGDGWIEKCGKEFVITAKTSEFIDWCIQHLQELGMSVSEKNRGHNKYKDVWYVRTGKKENMNILREKIFTHSYAGTIRKYERAHQTSTDISMNDLIESLNLLQTAPLLKWLRSNHFNWIPSKLR
ncbi:LAGLIDADG family homing endonuclease [Bacillus toyonensis]|uniref:LAGLIDADG family homing endonuclease n=1 Tax=Bacillus toyonensis TaxID=155322 RepID=UPI000BF5E71E|nr:LAGLIDADG family homing endonuclease [Bacillus toyonensis]PFW89206.1 hypothetical protein COL33_21880 [Bacillus toyonensis]PGC01184.1 hypothetical protein COM20_26840 [Bacillus toyonensis]